MNKDISTEGISPPELKFYFNHWGIKMTDEQFQEIYEWFDADGDGCVSYQDFNAAVGSEIHPGETPYFRFESKAEGDGSARVKNCKHLQCW